jgi:DNA-binding MarR family transcriptional regulator
MSKLEAAGYVEVKKEFVDKIPHTLLSLTSSGREAFREYKHNLKQVLNDLPD